MNKNQIDMLRTLLVRSCNLFQKKGGQIVDQEFGDGKECRCPMNCLVGGKASQDDWTKEPSKIVSELAAKKFGINLTVKNIGDFISGFDGFDDAIGGVKNNYFKLGKELRQKYIGKNNE